MRISPDEIIFWQMGFVKINFTLAATWLVMLLLVIGSAVVKSRLKTDQMISRWQNMLEIIVTGIKEQISATGLRHAEKYLSFIGTLFLFIAVPGLLTIIPRFEPHTASLSTTTALAISVFLAVPVFGIAEHGLLGYLRTYLEPHFLLLPFNIISELTRTLALAVRLFGNMMSGALIITILLGIAPFFFPVILTLLGLLTGMVQAYIFAVLASVYIAAATHTERKRTDHTIS
jgi:F-type H+-transporting ATPase subunit a